MSSLSFHYLSMAVHSMIQKNFMEQVKPSGLTSGQPKVLDYLRDHNGANQKEIAAACHIEPGSLTSVLNRMEENGYNLDVAKEYIRTFKKELNS